MKQELEIKEKDREKEIMKIQLRGIKETMSKIQVKARVKDPKFHEGEDVEIF